MKIAAQEVEKAFLDSLYKDDELPKGGGVPEGAVIVQGVLGRVGFNPVRLAAHRPDVKRWLEALPIEFRKSAGGGWSFLNACVDIGGEQWTGLHQRT